MDEYVAFDWKFWVNMKTHPLLCIFTGYIKYTNYIIQVLIPTLTLGNC